jgi:hypothetical protein
MAKTSTERTRQTRERQKQAGMRVVQLLLPDTRSPEFAREAARQSRLIGVQDRSPAGRETMDWIMRNSVLNDDVETG